MNVSRRPRLPATIALAGIFAAVAGCGHMPQWASAPHLHWPFGRHAAPAPQPVEELVIEAAPGTSAQFLQFWERNTLVLDMRSASGSGAVTLTPRAHTLWPVRLAFRVTPGAIGQLDVKGEERTVFPVAASGAAPVDLALAPSAYRPRTPAITLGWGPAPVLPAPPPPPARTGTAASGSPAAPLR